MEIIMKILSHFRALKVITYNSQINLDSRKTDTGLGIVVNLTFLQTL